MGGDLGLVFADPSQKDLRKERVLVDCIECQPVSMRCRGYGPLHRPVRSAILVQMGAYLVNLVSEDLDKTTCGSVVEDPNRAVNGRAYVGDRSVDSGTLFCIQQFDPVGIRL